MTENQLLEAVRDCAGWNGWLCYHTHNSRHSEAGFPDLVLVRPPRLIFAELKNATRKTTPAQDEWLARLRLLAVAQGVGEFSEQAAVIVKRGCWPEVYLWRPDARLEGRIEAILSNRKEQQHG